MDTDGTFNRGSFWSRPRGASSSFTLRSLSSSFTLPRSLSPFTSLPSITHLVWVDGHAGGEPHHGDTVEACCVRDGRRGEVVVGLGGVTHQDSVDLQIHRRRTLCHFDNVIKIDFRHAAALSGLRSEDISGALSSWLYPAIIYAVCLQNLKDAVNTKTCFSSGLFDMCVAQLWRCLPSVEFNGTQQPKEAWSWLTSQLSWGGCQ